MTSQHQRRSLPILSVARRPQPLQQRPSGSLDLPRQRRRARPLATCPATMEGQLGEGPPLESDRPRRHPTPSIVLPLASALNRKPPSAALRRCRRRSCGASCLPCGLRTVQYRLCEGVVSHLSPSLTTLDITAVPVVSSPRPPRNIARPSPASHHLNKLLILATGTHHDTLSTPTRHHQLARSPLLHRGSPTLPPSSTTISLQTSPATVNTQHLDRFLLPSLQTAVPDTSLPSSHQFTPTLANSPPRPINRPHPAIATTTLDQQPRGPPRDRSPIEQPLPFRPTRARPRRRQRGIARGSATRVNIDRWGARLTMVNLRRLRPRRRRGVAPPRRCSPWRESSGRAGTPPWRSRVEDPRRSTSCSVMEQRTLRRWWIPMSRSFFELDCVSPSAFVFEAYRTAADLWALQ